MFSATEDLHKWYRVQYLLVVYNRLRNEMFTHVVPDTIKEKALKVACLWEIYKLQSLRKTVDYGLCGHIFGVRH